MAVVQHHLCTVDHLGRRQLGAQQSGSVARDHRPRPVRGHHDRRDRQLVVGGCQVDDLDAGQPGSHQIGQVGRAECRDQTHSAAEPGRHTGRVRRRAADVVPEPGRDDLLVRAGQGVHRLHQVEGGQAHADNQRRHAAIVGGRGAGRTGVASTAAARIGEHDGSGGFRCGHRSGPMRSSGMRSTRSAWWAHRNRPRPRRGPAIGSGGSRRGSTT